VENIKCAEELNVNSSNFSGLYLCYRYDTY